MGRPPLPVGRHGNVSFRGVGTGKVRAACYVRDADGRRREVTATAPSRSKALAALQEKLDARPGFAGEMSGETPLAEVAAQWLGEVERAVESGQLAPNTERIYRGAWARHLAPAVGALRVREATAARLDAFLVAFRATHGPGITKTVRSVLSGVLGFAVRRGARTANPVRDLAPIPGARTRRPARALSAAERDQWLRAMDADEVACYHDVPGMTRVMLGTGVRISECLALLLDEMREDVADGVVRVEWQITRVTGVGLVRRRTKTAAGERTLRLPSWVTELVVERGEGRGWRGPLFPAPRSGGWRDPSNTSADLRAAAARADFGWVTSHVFRKTCATVLDEAGLSAREIADQLGHSKVSMTQDHYLGRQAVTARAAEALEVLGSAGNVVALPGVVGRRRVAR